MTSYSQSDYYYNNENDALSCNSRPISSTIHRKSSNYYESHHSNTMYDSYGNTKAITEGVIDHGIDGIGTSALAEDRAYSTPPSIYDTTINISAAQMMFTSSSSSSAVRTRSAAGMNVSSGSNSGGYDYEPSICRGTAYTTSTTNDNMMYHRDVYSSYNIACPEDNMYDKSDYGGGGSGGGSYDFFDNAIQQTCNGRGSVNGRHTSLGETTKMLPKLPIKNSNSIMDGMYTSNLQRYSKATTPPVVQQQQYTTPTTKNRMLPLTGAAAAYNVSSFAVNEIRDGYSPQYNQINGHNNYVVAAVGGGVTAAAAASADADGCGDCVKNAGNDGGKKFLPLAPLRTLPQPHTQQLRSIVIQRQKLFEDGTTTQAAAAATATTNEIFVRRNYDNTTINNYNFDNTAPTTTTTTTTVGGTMLSSPTSTANSVFDAFYHSMPQRPHTSIAPLNYNDDYSNFAYNSAENLSIYSESTATTAHHHQQQQQQQHLQQQQQQQQKLQQHRKHSIIMAMTTASVIASGETRIAPFQRKQQQQQKLLSTTATTTNNANSNVNANTSSMNIMRSSYDFEYDSSGVIAPRRQQYGSVATTETLVLESETSDLYNNERSRLNSSSRYASVNPQKSASTNGTALSSEMFSNMSMLSSSSVTASSFPLSSSSSAVTTTATTSRKLPKRLPTPKYKTTTISTTGFTTTATACSSSNSGSNRLNSSTSSKQLPKLPQAKVYVETVDDDSTTLATYSTTPITTTTTTTTATTTSAISLIPTSLSLTSAQSATLSSIYTTPIINAESDAKLATIITTSAQQRNNNNFNSSNISISNNNNNNLIIDHEDLSITASTNIKPFELPISISSASSLISSKTKVTSSSAAEYDVAAATITDLSYKLSKTTPFTADKVTTPPFDIADYLQPYSLPTYCVSSNISSSYEANAYALPPSSMSPLYTSTIESVSTFASTSKSTSTPSLANTMTTTKTSLSPSEYAIKSKTTTATTTAILSSYNAINFASDTASNFSNSSKLSNSSNISENLKSSDIYLDSSLTMLETATVKPSSSSSSTTKTATTTTTAVTGNSSTLSSSVLSTTNIMDDLNASKHSKTTESSSSSMFLSSFDFKSMAYKDSSLSSYTTMAESFPLDLITTTTAAIKDSSITTLAVADTKTSSNQFLDGLKMTTASNSSVTTTITSSSISCSNGYSSTATVTVVTNSYEDYLKKYNLDSSSTKLTADKQELPTYITDFLNCDYSMKYNPLTLDFKYEDYSAATTATTTTTTPNLTTSDYSEYKRKLSLQETDTTDTLIKTTTIAETTPSTVTTSSFSIIVAKSKTATTTKNDTEIANQLNMFNESNNLYNTQLLSTVAEMSSTNNSVMSSFDNKPTIADLATTTAHTATTTSSPVFDDNFYDSYDVDLSTLTATATVTTTTTADDAPAALNDIYTYNNNALLSTDNNYSSYIGSTTDYSYTLPNSLATTTKTLAQSQQEQQYHQKFDTATSIATTTTTTFGDSGTATITQGGYYKPTTSVADVTVTPQKTAVNAAAAAAGKASSMFGGFSKGIKGGLDGVLSGVGATITDTTKQQQQQQKEQQSSKKSSFGFGLASKLVPNVGGLLTSATTSAGNKQQQQQQTVTVSTTAAAASQLSRFPPDENDDGFWLAETTGKTNSGYDLYTNSALITTASTPTNDYTSTTNVTAATTYSYIMHEQDDDFAYSSKELLYTTVGSDSYHYNDVDDMLLNPGLVIYDRVADDQLDAELLLEKHQQNDFGNKYGDYDEFNSYREYGYDKQAHTLSDIVVVTTASGEIIATTTDLQQYPDYQVVKILDTDVATTVAAAPAVTITTTPGKSLAKKTTSSILSSLTNVVQASPQQQQQQQQQQTAPPITTTATAQKTTSNSGGGGMFGSFFGKAAAAVQSATQVVNQGASMATAVVQKVPAAAAATAAAAAAAAATTTTATATSVVENASAVTITTTGAHKTTSGYDLMLHNDYNNQLLTHQDSLSSQYSTTGDDYENSNLIVYTTLPSFNNHRNDKTYTKTNCFSNSNQSQQQQQMKMLPTVPSVGSTGKKLPTINGKSGYLIKQRPTEIFDLDDNIGDLDTSLDIVNGDVNELIDVVGHKPNYGIDSEQNDYYMDHRPTTPSSHLTMPANGYYEHTNGGYDYREDYFNEEDEYKYLEKEEAQKAQEEMLYQKQKQQHGNSKKSKVLLHENKLSLEYGDNENEQDDENRIDDYIDDNYPSEDSGNYLDESSSGSVGVGAAGVSVATIGITNPKSTVLTDEIPSTTTTATPNSTRMKLSTTLAATSVATTVLHQQIKKQDSIIMEEDEDELCGLNDINGAGLSRKSSNIMLDDDDQLADLPSATQTHILPTKKRVLMRGETEEVVGGHMLQMIRKPEVTAKQRWHWAYNKIIMQLNLVIM